MLEGVVIRLVEPVHFIATKLEAFKDRGKSDFAESHDLEDIMAVVNARREIVDEVAASPDDVRAFVVAEIAALLANPVFMNVMPGHVERGRDEILATRLRQICAR